MSRAALGDNLNAQLAGGCASGLGQVEGWVQGQHRNAIHWAQHPHVLAALQDIPAAPSAAAAAELNAQTAELKRIVAQLGARADSPPYRCAASA